MPATFRQIGVPPSTVHQELLKIQKSLESLINRRSSPQKCLQTLDRLLLQPVLQNPMSGQLCGFLRELQIGIDGKTITNGDMRPALRKALRLAAALAQRPLPTATVDQQQQYRRFLDAAASKGWGVPTEAAAQEDPQDLDGFAQSIRLIKSISTKALLPEQQPHGVTHASIVVLHQRAIPESVLLDWSRRQDVYVVFGRYCCLVDVPLLGLRHDLAKDKDELRLARFSAAARHYPEIEAKTILSPRLAAQHYYCPCPDVKHQDDQYFTKWDILR